MHCNKFPAYPTLIFDRLSLLSWNTRNLCSLINRAAIQNKWWTPHVQYNSPCDITLFFTQSALCISSSSQQNMLRTRANMKRPSWLAESRRNGTMRESTTLYRRDSTRCEPSRGRNRDSPGRQQIVFSSHGYSQCHQLVSVTGTNKVVITVWIRKTN